MTFHPRVVLTLALALQLAFAGVMAADAAGLRMVPTDTLRPLVGFTYLSAVPGVLLLGILRVRAADLADLIVCGVGASVSLLMVLGATMNSVLPHFGVHQPITEKPLALAVSVVVLVLCSLYYHRGRPLEILQGPSIRIDRTIMQALLLATIVLGARLFLHRSANGLLLVAVGTIALVPLIALNRRGNAGDTWLIWVVGLSLLWFRALSQQYLDVIGDPYVERYFASLVQEAGLWDPGIRNTHNAMLGEVILLPLYTILLNIRLDDTFKVVYPMLFALMPVAAYRFHCREFGREVGLLAAFLIMFNPVFFNDYAQATRWGMALFFLATILRLVSDGPISPPRGALIVAFSFALIASHYTTAYKFMLFLTVLSGIILGSILLRRTTQGELSPAPGFIFVYAALYVALMFLWYSNVASGAAISLLKNVSIFQALPSGRILEYPGFASTMYFLQQTWPLSIRVTLFLTYLVFLMAGVGVMRDVYLALRRQQGAASPFYLCVTVAYTAPLILFVILGSTRAQFMSLLLLAPYAVTGSVTVWRLFAGMTRAGPVPARLTRTARVALCLCSTALLLFSSGFVSEVALRKADYAPTTFISRARLHEIGEPYFTFALFRSYLPARDVSAARWLAMYRAPHRLICADGVPGDLAIGMVGLVGYGLIPGEEILPLGQEAARVDCYLYLRYYSYVLRSLFRVFPLEKYSVEELGLADMTAIYTNGGAGVFAAPSAGLAQTPPRKRQ